MMVRNGQRRVLARLWNVGEAKGDQFRYLCKVSSGKTCRGDDQVAESSTLNECDDYNAH
jgi:hypothetical protein